MPYPCHVRAKGQPAPEERLVAVTIAVIYVADARCALRLLIVPRPAIAPNVQIQAPNIQRQRVRARRPHPRIRTSVQPSALFFARAGSDAIPDRYLINI